MTDYQRITAAIRYLQDRASQQPSLAEVARHTGLSPYHFQRLFRRFAGVSPKRFLQHLTNEHAKRLLKASETILETSFSVGLSGPGRLHDLLVSVEAVTPGEFKSGGRELKISYGFHPTPFGDCLLAITARGICRLEFSDRADDESLVQQLATDWPNARLVRDQSATLETVSRIFRGHDQAPAPPLPLLLKGTNFQLKVWTALLNIPPGCIASYGQVAAAIGHPRAGRAVGTALAGNPIGYLIPCHRVLRRDGGFGQYRWGRERKQALLGHEFCGKKSAPETDANST